jgi:hypothetical protein
MFVQRKAFYQTASSTLNPSGSGPLPKTQLWGVLSNLFSYLINTRIILATVLKSLGFGYFLITQKPLVRIGIKYQAKKSGNKSREKASN